MKTLACKDVGMKKCDYIAKGKTEDDVLKLAKKHAKEHGVEEVTEEYLKSWRKKIHEE